MTDPSIIAPNGLPVCVFRVDGTQLEHEHADHPTYQYPVDVVFVGSVLDDHRTDYLVMAGAEPESDQQVRDLFRERHALIYTDDHSALTLYEKRYFLWRLKDGRAILVPQSCYERDYRLVVPLARPVAP